MLRLLMLLVSITLVQKVSAKSYTHDSAQSEEVRVRDGLPNFFAKIQSGKCVRVAYFGGSITAAQGWRPKTLAWMKSHYPAAQFEEINAAISGTGSDYAACRVRGDVLAHKPDLIFLECRVNGGNGYEKPSVEGVVRQIWAADPTIDICFVYTVCSWMLNDLHAGKQTPFGRTMEEIANVYGIPTIDLGLEICKREQEGSLIFKADAPVQGKLVFSRDAVHPGDEGHAVYCQVVARSLLKMPQATKSFKHALPEPLVPTCWASASLLPIASVVKSEDWTPVDSQTDHVYRNDFGRTDAMLRGAMKTEKIGARFTVAWEGITFGISDIPYDAIMELEVQVDNGAPRLIQRKQTETRKHARFWYHPELPYGKHTATITVKTLAPGQSFYAGHVLLIGGASK